MIVVDNTFLSLLLHPKARPPRDPATGKPVAGLDDRIELLIEEWELNNETILIPAPVLSEFLILADKAGPQYLTDIDANRLFTVASFDQKAAVELAVMNLALMRGKTRRGTAQGTWAKINFDRQIVAIAKANGASAIYSDDKGLENFATQQSISVVRTWELPLPPAKQIDLPGVEAPKPKRAISNEAEDEV
jgi:predicted nucleic acid-binding protein